MLTNTEDTEFLFRELAIWGMSNINRDMILKNFSGQRKKQEEKKGEKKKDDFGCHLSFRGDSPISEGCS